MKGSDSTLNKTVVDRVGRRVTYHYPPKRIVSLCPGITDTLFALDLEEKIVGRTRFCIFPKDKAENVPAVAGTKDIKLEAIQAVQPDLIIVEKEENTKEIVDALEKYFPVYVAEVQSVGEAFRMIEEMGNLTDRIEAAAKLVSSIQQQFDSLPKAHEKRIAYVIWRKPYMVVGKDTYINSLLEKIGFINPFINAEGRYPAVSAEDFQKANLDYVFLASEPFPFKEKHLGEFIDMMPETKPILVDGEMFWYGPRMLEAAHYFQQHLGI
ncbi:ABC transporter substrate-binding protein [Sporosarcina highlanderae]|uniref:Helical backbone metal receptor n=1 Tax=Sporosarcina highlanderae TaxID=3035916 RepID=A0ABT8JUC1_9BACL|nr:helical backbone metal receptor [Sporosarcina highlanderae]MDN4608547.1 helical backbone metal receptor [Sporosarcina highlanderae]